MNCDLFTIKPLTHEEKVEYARETVGLGTWDELSQEEREELIQKEVWKPEVRNETLESKDLRDSDDEDAALKPVFTKSAKKLTKSKKA